MSDTPSLTRPPPETAPLAPSPTPAASGAKRWYALLIEVPTLFYATRGVLRALIGAHTLV